MTGTTLIHKLQLNQYHPLARNNFFSRKCRSDIRIPDSRFYLFTVLIFHSEKGKELEMGKMALFIEETGELFELEKMNFYSEEMILSKIQLFSRPF